MKKFYKITPITVIENDSGTYEVWCEKQFCFNFYKFFGIQVSIKANGKHYYINKKIEDFSFFLPSKPGAFPEKPLNKHETHLNRFYKGCIGKTTKYKREFEEFKQEIILKAHNEFY